MIYLKSYFNKVYNSNLKLFVVINFVVGLHVKLSIWLMLLIPSAYVFTILVKIDLAVFNQQKEIKCHDYYF